MDATERVRTTIGGLQMAEVDILSWHWYAEQVLDKVEGDDLVVFWYTAHGMRGVGPFLANDRYVEVFFSDPDVRHAFRSDDPSTVPIHGRQETRAAGLHEIVEALAKGETLHLAARAAVSTVV